MTDTCRKHAIELEVTFNNIKPFTAEASFPADTCPYCEIDRLKAGEKAADAEIERLKELARSTTLQRNEYFTKLSRYEGAVEYETTVSEYKDFVLYGGRIDIGVPKEFIGQRVTVLVMRDSKG